MGLKTREIIQRFNIRMTKSLGQNFLTDENIVRKIVDAAGVGESDLIIEIGPGVGSMTVELAARGGKVVAIEIDRHLIAALTENMKDYKNFEVLNKDIMETDVNAIISEGLKGGESGGLTGVKVVANLPYYITTPIIMKLLEEVEGIDTMVFMVQKEVADRMVAKPGGKDYGALSVAVQYYSKPEKAFDVPPHCFVPQPEVDSTVIRLNIYKEPPVQLTDKDMFFKTVKASFGQRRKTLVNALANSGYFMENKEELKQILESLGVKENQRGETLSIMQFAQLSNALCVKNCKKG